MGYYMDQIGQNFNIKKENIEKAWHGLIELFNKEEKSCLDASGYHYSWICTAKVLEANSFAEAMSEARWDIGFDNEGNINRIWFLGEKYGGDETIILGSIAPYVENNSYIIMQGEDGERWKWKFADGLIKKIHSKLVWDDKE